MIGLYYYKLVSEYPEMFTKNCKLTIQEIDHDFKTLKDADISAATYVKDEDSKGTLVLIRNNGDKIAVQIDTTIDKNLTYDFNASAVCGDEKGQTLTITWKDDEGVEKKTVIENIITADNLIDVLGSDVLTKVITDSSLKGLGTLKSPLGIAGVEKTGMLAPAIKVIDLTDPTATPLPKDAKEGTRYVTKEYVNDYGYLYNGIIRDANGKPIGGGLYQIQELLDHEYEDKEIGKEVCNNRDFYWRVPTKEDWDKLLNSIEPCNEYRNHNSAACHRELGKLAGKYLKSECGWLGQDECDCSGTKPYNSCGNSSPKQRDTDNEWDVDDYMFDNTDTIPSDAVINPSGIDKYGMTIRPSGNALKKNDSISYNGFRELAFFWTTSNVSDSLDQDTYVKVFEYDKGGVYQVAECPDPYYSVRLVKDYDGSNYKAVEYIDGVPYRAVLFPETKQIWLGSNFANTKDKDGNRIDFLKQDRSQVYSENRTEMFINEYNGRYWEKKVMEEGTTIVIQNPCLEHDETRIKKICNDLCCIEVEIKHDPQKNAEYRVVTDDDDSCSKTLVNTDDYVLERVLNIVGGEIARERCEREDADYFIHKRIDREKERRKAADEALSGAIDTEREERIAADEAISGAIEDERDRAISAETALADAIIAEYERARDRENELEGLIDAEASARTSADSEIWSAITEISASTLSGITELREALSAETEARISGDSALTDAIIEEMERAEMVESALSASIDTEREERIKADEELSGRTFKNILYKMSATTYDDGDEPVSPDEKTPNLIIESEDGNPDHFIRIQFDGNFGTISW